MEFIQLPTAPDIWLAALLPDNPKAEWEFARACEPLRPDQSYRTNPRCAVAKGDCVIKRGTLLATAHAALSTLLKLQNNF